MSPKENEELIRYRFGKAKEALMEVQSQIVNKFWNLAVSRLYYACFYAVSALLATKNVYTKTHSGAKTMFGLHFVKTGIVNEEQNQFYIMLFSMRQDGDYEDYCDYEEGDVVELLEPAREFINTIERILENR